MSPSEYWPLLEPDLARPLPAAFKQALEAGESLPLPPLILDSPNGARAVQGFLREWHPLSGTLFPIEHLGDGIFACLHLGAADGEPPVLSWDVAADLAEQPCAVLAKDWETYARLRAAGDFAPYAEHRAQALRREVVAPTELEAALRSFEESADRFAQGYERKHGRAFAHDADNVKVKDRDWKPERFAVHDHLLGVMAYRFNPHRNTVDVTGFATRDHTNYARGSATAGLLLGLLCEWATRGADSIRFLSHMPRDRSPYPRLAPLPYEIALFARLHGAGIGFQDEEIGTKPAARLLLALTPFPAAIRRTLADRAGQSVGACLNVHRQVWSPTEAALLLLNCPRTEALFRGEAEVGEQLGFSILSDHAHAARLCGCATAALEAAAEASAAPGPWIEFPQAGKASLYCVACRTTLASEWRLAADPDGRRITIDAGQQLVVVGLPFADRLAGAAAQGALERLRYGLEAQYPHAQWLGLVPNRTVLPATRPQGITLVEAETELPQLDADLLERLRQSRSIRT
jgi:hypothetical protein